MKKALSLLLAVLMLVSLAACSSGGNGTASATQGGATTPAQADDAASGDSAKKLTVWVEKIFSDDANNYMVERVQQYGKDTGVDVTCELVAVTDFVTKLNAAIEAGVGVPDVISADATRLVNYYPDIPCVDVSDLVNEINETRPYFKATYEGTKIGDSHYFVPFCSSSTLMFVRKDKLADAGITEMPKTWDDVVAAARAVSDPANDFYGLGMGCGDTDDDDENMFREWVWNEGGSLFKEDGTVIADEGTFAEIATLYGDLYKEGVIPPDATTWDSGGNNGSYLAGRTAIVFNAPTLYNAMANNEEYKELLENSYIAAPPVGSVNGVYMSFNRGFGIMNTCKDMDTAKDFLQYMMDKTWYDEYMDQVAPVYAPVFEDEKENPTWRDNEVNAAVLAYAENASGYYGWPVATLEGRAIAAKHMYMFPFEKVFNQVATGTATAESAIQEQIFNIEDLAAQFK